MSLRLTLEQQRKVLTDNRVFIIDHLNSDDVIDALIEAKTLIGENAAQKVKLSVFTNREKNGIIIDELCRAGPGALEKLCQILRGKEKLKFIAEQLEKCEWANNVTHACMWFINW